MKRAICLASIALLLCGCCGVSKGCDRVIASQGSRLADAPSCAQLCTWNACTGGYGPEMFRHLSGPGTDA